MNADSTILGRKDVIKIKDVVDLDLSELGLLDRLYPVWIHLFE